MAVAAAEHYFKQKIKNFQFSLFFLDGRKYEINNFKINKLN